LRGSLGGNSNQTGLRENLSKATCARRSHIFPVSSRSGTEPLVGARGSGRQLTALRSNLTSIWTVRDGRVVKIEWFFDHAQALEAVGLSEQDAHADS